MNQEVPLSLARLSSLRISETIWMGLCCTVLMSCQATAPGTVEIKKVSEFSASQEIPLENLWANLHQAQIENREAKTELQSLRAAVQQARDRVKAVQRELNAIESAYQKDLDDLSVTKWKLLEAEISKSK